MILLHRLSYLKFNNRSMSLGGVKIITPNQDFNTHINELSGELDIDSIRRFTVEEYYVDLINRYSRSDRISAEVGSESNLKPALLSEIYSLEFIVHLQEQYHLYWETVLEAIDESSLKPCFQRHGVAFPQLGDHNSLAAANLESGLHRIIGEVKESIEKYNEQQRRKAALEADLQKTNDVYDQMSSEITGIRGQMVDTMRAELAVISDRIAQITNYIQPTRTRLQELVALDNGASDEVNRAERALTAIRQNYQAYTDYNSFVQMHDDVSDSIARTCKNTIDRITGIEGQIQKTPAYNFVKRNALRRQLQDATQSFSDEARRQLDTLIAEKESQLAQNSSAARVHQEEIQELSRSVETTDREISQLQSKQKALQECISDILDSASINQRIVMSIGAQDELISYFVDYERLSNNLNKQAKQLTDIRKRISILESQIVQPYEDDLSFLEKCEAEAGKLKANEVYRLAMRKALLDIYKKHGVEYTRTNYRHKLFVMLLFCSLYYPRIGSVDSYLNIDEAQDISIAEYRLLRRILGNKCVFNLYGDINQALYPEKCIVDWDELREVIGEKVYVLNEDYRNTLQITEYCNHEFYSEIYPIGIKGDPVVELDIEQAVKWLSDLRTTNPNDRYAVIVHRERESIKATLTDSMPEEDFSWNKVNDKKISVLTVEHAKGLEFETVMVLCHGMEINEQYIAYTRALNHLCVVK